MKKNILIVGTNFMNKGAESMLYVLTDEIKKISQDNEVYFGCNGEQYDEEQYVFHKILYTLRTQRIALATRKPVLELMKYRLKDCVKYVIGRRDDLWKTGELRDLMPRIDLILDASGYELADHTRDNGLEYYLNSIRLAKQYGIPIILMPQSFGPFRFTEERKYYIGEIRELMEYPAMVYAREKDGEAALKAIAPKAKLRMSSDLVLQCESINAANILRKGVYMETPVFPHPGTVAVIPNYHCFEGNLEKRNKVLYQKMISRLLDMKKQVCILRHASGDRALCKEIYDPFSDNENVQLLEKELDCLEFDASVGGFDLVICSRFHGCVHSYRNHVPVLILGWAVKYRELAEQMGQERFVFDITGEADHCDEILKAIDELDAHLATEKKTIEDNLQRIRKDSCFDVLNRLLRETGAL